MWRSRVSFIGFLICITGCSGSKTSPTAPSQTGWSIEQIRNQIVESNIEHLAFPFPRGRLTRFETPISVNTNGIARAEEAIGHYESWTGGLISFTRVSTIPETGIVFVEGGGMGPGGEPSCGNVTDAPPPAPSPFNRYKVNQAGGLIGTQTIHLGSTTCNDAKTGNYTSAIAEHETGHALGLANHFDGFVGNEGLRNGNMFSVIYNIYKNPIGATSSDLVIAIPPTIPR